MCSGPIHNLTYSTSGHGIAKECVPASIRIYGAVPTVKRWRDNRPRYLEKILQPREFDYVFVRQDGTDWRFLFRGMYLVQVML